MGEEKIEEASTALKNSLSKLSPYVEKAAPELIIKK